MRRARVLTGLRRAVAPLGIAVLCIAMALGGDGARELFRYDRIALADFELWRLVSAHLVHLSAGHTALNVTALAIIALLFDTALDSFDWIVSAALAALAIDFGLYFFSPDVVWYVGLSGALHGIMVAGALALAVARSRLGAVLIVLVVAKIAWEHWAGPLPLSELTSGGPVVTEAHLYGAVGGAIAYAALYSIRGSRIASL
ncbi:MAG TPA: rhombosortase [Gammaproteobacteria bacterium]|jgi:rhomboid family GlyGly-CTERM serine protease